MNQLPAFSESPVTATSIIGTEVVTPGGDNLGDIKEIEIDPATGKVAYAVVDFGGFLSLDEKLFAIPFSLFEYNAEGNECVLDISKERLEAALASILRTGLQWRRRNGVVTYTSIRTESLIRNSD